MGLYFRKRIKVAPGFRLNLSRSGVSASIGRRGASFTIGNRGAHVNASIPGTGVYYRQKLWSKKRKRNIKTSNLRTHSPHMFSSKTYRFNNQSFNSHYSDNQNIVNVNSGSKITRKGCAKGFLWALLVLDGFVFLVGSVGLILDSNGGAQTSDWIIDCFFGIVTICCVLLIVKLNKSNSISSKQEENIIKQIAVLKNRINEETNPLKVKILNHQLGDLISNEANFRLIPLIEEQNRKISKNPNPELEQLLQEYDDELKAAKEEAKSLVYDIVGELTEEEKKNYAVFCEKYHMLRNSDRIWIVVSKESNLEYKSSVKTLVKKRRYCFETGYFNQLKILFDVPLISVLDQEYYFYPRFVIAAKGNEDFEIMPLRDIKLSYKSVRFHEEGEIPQDAQKVGETYKYVNTDGNPDLRYSDNPIVSVLLYGELSIEPVGVTFQVSNNQAVADLKSSFLALQTSCNWNYKD